MTLHAALVAAAQQVAGAFFGAFLLKNGVGLALTILAYAGSLGIRFFLRFLVLILVRRFGLRPIVILGTILQAVQFLMLARAGGPGGLLPWMLSLAIADALYWPVFHALMAASAEPGRRGTQLGALEAMRALAGVAGPAIGGWLLAHAGGGATFGLGALVELAAIIPVWSLPDLPAGPVPGFRKALAGDRVGFLLAASDGWLTMGWWYVWTLALFLTLDGNFTVYGGALALSGLVAAALGLVAGRLLDLGHGTRMLMLVSTIMVAAIAARALSVGHPTLAFIVNAVSAMAAPLYTTTYMRTLYNRSKQHGAFAFSFFAEAGWDAGAGLGCVAASLIVASGLPLSFAILPALLGMAALHLTMLAAERNPPRLASE